MLWIIAIIGIALGIVYIFASPQLSPIPFYRSNPKDLNLILKLLNLRNNQVVLDLGAGDGLIILKAAQYCFEKKLNTEFVAVETNPILILLIWTKLLSHPNRKRVHIVMKSLFEINYSELIKTMFKKKQMDITFYHYLTPWLISSVYKQLRNDLDSFNVVSYFYPLKIKYAKKEQGVNNIYFYTIKSL